MKTEVQEEHSSNFAGLDCKHFHLRRYSSVNTAIQLGWIAVDWCFIFLFIFAAQYFNTAWAYLPCIFLIASRQHALLVIAHDCAHFRISKSKVLNDLIGNLFCSFPSLIGVDSYRSHHSNHHRYLNSEKDPDWARKIHLEEWQFPMKRTKLARIFFRQLFFGGIEWVILAYSINSLNDRKRAFFKRESTGVFVLWSLAFICFGYLGYLTEFLIYWIAPLMLFMPLLQRLRSISEHFGLPRKNELSSSRITSTNLIAEFLFAPHSVNYHLVHHLFPSIPHYNVKKVFRILMQDHLFAEQAYINDSFLFGVKSNWADLVQNKKTTKEVN